MLTVAQIIFYLVEGLAVVASIYLITKKRLDFREVALLTLSVSLTFMILELFAPVVSLGANAGTGFVLGLGAAQVGGYPTPMPRQWYVAPGQAQDTCQPVAMMRGGDATSLPKEYFNIQGGCRPSNETIEGMDDPEAIAYYKQYNPQPDPRAQIPAIIMDQLDPLNQLVETPAPVDHQQ